jgi:CHAT domain-containing protein
VNGLVADMRDALQAPADPWQPSRGAKLVLASKADPTVAARSLHDLLIAPIAADLEGVETVIFAPEGRLRYVPFAALYDGERYLVENVAVSLLTASGSTTTHRPVDRGAKLLALSNPDGSLPGASAEALAIARTWGRRRTLAHDGAAATEDQLRADLDGVRLLHLATHGVLRSDAPRESYLLFAADSHLTVREITLLPLENIDLAVLSACETAVGDQGEGREIAGLAYQLEVRGAAAVVASLWAVNDEGTSRLMSDLYGNLAKRRARTEALREAQLAMLRDPELRHPYYWAPFVLIGDWR